MDGERGGDVGGAADRPAPLVRWHRLPSLPKLPVLDHIAVAVAQLAACEGIRVVPEAFVLFVSEPERHLVHALAVPEQRHLAPGSVLLHLL